MSAQEVSQASKQFILGNKARDLLVYTMEITDNRKCFPNFTKHEFVPAIQRAALEVLTEIITANELLRPEELEKRIEHQRNAITACQRLNTLVLASVECHFITPARGGYWTRQITEVKRMLFAWNGKDSERFNKAWVRS